MIAEKRRALPHNQVVSPLWAALAALVVPNAIRLVDALRTELFAAGILRAMVRPAVLSFLAYVFGRYVFAARTRRSALVRSFLTDLVPLLVLPLVWWILLGDAPRPAMRALFSAIPGHPVRAFILAVLAVPAILAGFAGSLSLPYLIWPLLGTRSPERGDKAVIAAAVWLAIPQLALYIAAQYLGHPLTADTAHGEAVNFWFEGALPLAVAGCFAFRVALRRRWLSRVEQGREAGWRMDEAAEAEAPSGLPLLAGRDTAPGKVLVRVVAAEEPFRSVDVEPVAMVRR